MDINVPFKLRIHSTRKARKSQRTWRNKPPSGLSNCVNICTLKQRHLTRISILLAPFRDHLLPKLLTSSTRHWSRLKKRKLDGREKRIVTRIGTRTHHFLDFLALVMDALDKNNLYGKTLVIDNARIHHLNLIH